MSFAQLDGDSDVEVDGQEKEEGANELGRLVEPEGAPGAGALVVAADAAEDARRGHREYSRLRQLMEMLHRDAKDKYDVDGDYEQFKKVEKIYEELYEVEDSRLFLKYPGLF